MSPLHDPSFLAHFAQCKVSAKQQVNSMIDAIYAKVLLDLELWLNKHQSNDSIKSDIDSDCEENVTHHNNLPGQSQFDQGTEAENDHLQNEVSLSNTINTGSMIKQEFDDEQIERRNKQIETDEYYDNDQVDDDYNEGGKDEYLNEPICANEVCDLDNANNNNHLNRKVSAGEGDETDIETNLDEAQLQIDISATNNTQTNNQNDNNEICVSKRNMEQSTPFTSGVRSSTRNRIQTKVFGDFVQSNGNTRNSAKRKSDQMNESGEKMKRTQIFDDDGNTDSDDSDAQENHATNSIGEESIATECTTNPIQPNLAQPNRHLQCSHCPKSFVGKSDFTGHLRVHTGERPFQCDQCGKQFSTKSNLTKHQLIHQNIKRFRCDQCDKQFTQKFHLECHLRTHSGERPHQCRFCDKSFAQLITWKRHEQAIHLHVKPYRCKQCGHTATQRSVVIKHIREVHFGLPRSIKQQHAINIIDERDPEEYIEKV